MTDLPLARARELVARAVDKAEQLGLRGAIAVVGASGGLITCSRLDRGGHGGVGRATSKAWIAATQQIASSEHLQRMTTLPAPISAGFVAVSPQARFPGAGGMPVRDADGRVVAGIAASGATVSPFLPEGVAPEVVSADGEPANPEDLLIAYALGVPYAGQHGDDRQRWQQRFGDLTVSAADSLGTKAAPRAAAQPQLAWAQGIADRVLALAAEAGLRVAVTVADAGGDAVQQDRMDGAAVAFADVALATAVTAARFGVPSGTLRDLYGADVAGLAALHPDPFLAAPGAVPLFAGDVLLGAVGVGGADPAICAELAGQVAS